MKFILTIDLDNAAFDDEGAEVEVDRILDVVRAEHKGNSRENMLEWCGMTLRDSNGNRVGGAWAIR